MSTKILSTGYSNYIFEYFILRFILWYSIEMAINYYHHMINLMTLKRHTYVYRYKLESPRI